MVTTTKVLGPNGEDPNYDYKKGKRSQIDLTHGVAKNANLKFEEGRLKNKFHPLDFSYAKKDI